VEGEQYGGEERGRKEEGEEDDKMRKGKNKNRMVGEKGDGRK
jgi:hypothetical protein